MTNILPEKLGLTENEMLVYTSMLEQPGIKPSQIGKETGLARGVVYFILDSLIEKGLVNRIGEGKRFSYEPAHPEALLENLESKLLEMTNNKSYVKSIIPLLVEQFNEGTNRPSIRYLDGVEGVKEAYLDTLNSKTDIHAILQSFTASEELLDWLRNVYTKERVKNRIFARVLLASSEGMEKYVSDADKYLREVAVIPSEKFPALIELDIYDDKISLISAQEENSKFAIIIQSEYIANAVLSLWKLAWAGAKYELVEEGR